MPSVIGPRSAHAVEVGVLVGIGNLLIFDHFVGASAIDIKSADPFNPDIEKSERTALYACIGFTTAVSLLVRSWDTFLVGGAILVAADFGIKHANAYNPAFGKMGGGQPVAAGNDDSWSMPEYATDQAA